MFRTFMLAFRSQGTRTTEIEQGIDFIKELTYSPATTESPQRKKVSHKYQVQTNTTQKEPKTAPTRVGRSQYIATAHNKQTGIIDKNQTINGHSILLLHVPKKYKTFMLDVHVGDILQAQGLHNTTNTCNLQVTFVARSKYFRPGERISSCVVGVDTEAWTSFKENFIKATHSKKGLLRLPSKQAVTQQLDSPRDAAFLPV